ncbi:carbohydrate esterase family 3 protein [Sodiomyces alcalophilus JCM 7366]|uniref:carbohydrate esterase family 3 protein n=1 Tax=Sodiomyces alcalophilus JCM 7366 TaxID=591952 RepID=UPI0039B6DAF0
MPLGASITYGQGSSDGNGYRQLLRDLLTEDGYNIDYVGTRSNGTMDDNDVEGWPGFRIAEVAAKANESVPAYLPNLVLINAGTNDCIQGKDPDRAGEQMLELFDQIRAASSRVSVVLSTLLVNKNDETDACVRRVNDQFRSLVLDQQARSRKIVLADMYAPGGPTVDDLVDATHPGDAGFEKMAAVWFDSIRDAASRGWLEAPQVLPPPPVGNSTGRN